MNIVGCEGKSTTGLLFDAIKKKFKGQKVENIPEHQRRNEKEIKEQKREDPDKVDLGINTQNYYA